MDQKDLHGNKVDKPKPHLVMDHVPGHKDWVYPEDWLEENEPLTEEEIRDVENELGSHRSPFEKCGGCDEHLIDISRQYDYALAEGRYSDKADAFICFPCRESDEQYGNTIFVFKPDDNVVEKYVVRDYFDEKWQLQYDIDEADEGFLEDLKWEPDDWDFNEKSPIQFKYVRTDGWRGYHDPVVPEGWIEVHGDSILSWSTDARHLKEFDTDLKVFLWRMGVEFAMGIGMTSNLFSSTYTVLANTNQDEMNKLMSVMAIAVKVSKLRAEYRDRDRFMRTALTGSGEKTEHADKMVQAHDMFEEGMTLEEVVKELV